MLDIKKQVKDKEVSILIIPSEKYKNYILDFAKNIESNFKRPCFVNLNRPYAFLEREFKKAGINPDKFFFIDGITKVAVEKVKEIKNCVFVSSPDNLVDLSLAIGETLKTFKPDILVFDSLSTLLIYENIGNILKFARNIIGKIRLSESKAVFIVIEGDAETKLIKKIKSFVDKVVKL